MWGREVGLLHGEEGLKFNGAFLDALFAFLLQEMKDNCGISLRKGPSLTGWKGVTVNER